MSSTFAGVCACVSIITAFTLANCACTSSNSTAPEWEEVLTVYDQWQNGPPARPDYFPIAVWLQSPSNASRYKAAGINLYVGLWEGPTESQLADLAAAGMQVVCAQNDVGLAHIDDPLIVGWMHDDEPDNAQWNATTESYDPPISPAVTIADYQAIKARDPSRPVLLNLGQGVAWDGYVGRGVRTNHPEDYGEYIQGTDIVSFDIYPVASTRSETHGKLWLVPFGVERLVQWSTDRQPVWNCIECTRIHEETRKATPHQVKAEVWMSLIHGSQGLIYFVHEWKPEFNEHALLDDPEMLDAVTAINAQIRDLAPVLNSPTLTDAVSTQSSNGQVPVATMAKGCGSSTYLFAAGMRDGSTNATFTLTQAASATRAEVLGENRTIPVEGSVFTDNFAPYEVHLYRVD